MNVSLFNRRAALLVLLALLLPPAARSAPERAQPAAATAGQRPLDDRTHSGYEGWERIIPTHLKAQYAGGMGLASVAMGWDYGSKCRWETDLGVGFLPRAYGERFRLIFALRQHYIPWSIRCGERLRLEPFTCGGGITLITGEEFWLREPARYPSSRYYLFPTRLRLQLHVGQRLTWRIRDPRSSLRDITLYYELTANDLDIVSKCTNSTLGLDRIVSFSVGIKFRIMR